MLLTIVDVSSVSQLTTAVSCPKISAQDVCSTNRLHAWNRPCFLPSCGCFPLRPHVPLHYRRIREQNNWDPGRNRHQSVISSSPVAFSCRTWILSRAGTSSSTMPTKIIFNLNADGNKSLVTILGMIIQRHRMGTCKSTIMFSSAVKHDRFARRTKCKLIAYDTGADDSRGFIRHLAVPLIFLPPHRILSFPGLMRMSLAYSNFAMWAISHAENFNEVWTTFRGQQHISGMANVRAGDSASWNT